MTQFPQKTQGRYSAGRVDPDQAPALSVALWRGGGMSDDAIVAASERRANWLYHENPAGPPVTWFVREGDDVVGCAALVPRVALVGGREVRAGMIIDFLLNEKHRFAGPAVLLQRCLKEQSAEAGFEVVFGYPNAKAWPIFARVGYRAVDTATEYLRPLETEETIEKALTKTSAARYVPTKLSPLLAKGASVVADVAVKGLDRLRSVAPRFRADVLLTPDERFDKLASEAIRHQGFWLVRDRGYLEWRYTKHPTQDYRFVALTRRGASLGDEELVAYAVYSVGKRGGAHIEDLTWVGGPENVEMLFLRLLVELRAQGFSMASLSCAGAPPCDLERLLFLKRPTASDRRLISRSSQNDEVVLQSDSWSVCDGELDI